MNKEFSKLQQINAALGKEANVVSVVIEPDRFDGKKGILFSPITFFVSPKEEVFCLQDLNQFGENLLKGNSLLNDNFDPADRFESGQLKPASKSAFEKIDEDTFRTFRIELLPNVPFALERSNALMERITGVNPRR